MPPFQVKHSDEEREYQRPESSVQQSHRMDENGKELITQLHQADDLLGFGSLVDASARKETATAMEAVELAGLTTAALKELVLENHNLAVELINLLSDDLLSSTSSGCITVKRRRW